MILNANAKQIPLADESVDIVFTSPPYNVGLKYNTYDDKMEDEDYKMFALAWLVDAFRVIHDTGRMYVVLNDEQLFNYRVWCALVGFTFIQILTWCKPNLIGGAGKINNDWNYLTEQILMVRKGKRTNMQSGGDTNTHNYFVIPTPQSNWKREDRIHPAQFPIKLPYRILSRTPGHIVLDPFCGSGTTCAAAHRLGRQFIGFDLDMEYCRGANNRMRNETGHNVVAGTNVMLPMEAHNETHP